VASSGYLAGTVEHAAAVALRPLHWLIAAPSFVFLATLAIMLFRPPNLEFYSLDRIAFGVLVFTVLLRAFALRQSLWVAGPVTWPMLALVILAFAGVIGQPYDAATWSLFAAKWVVPFVLYHLAGFAFEDEAALRWFEAFALITLAYLIFIAIAFLIGARELVFPSFILDEGLGIHADRARGPFLQAVANGVTLNMLGLLALDSFRRKRLRGILALLFLFAFPIAILATKTRAVWLSSAASLLVLLVVCRDSRILRACNGMVLMLVLGTLVAVSLATSDGGLSSRLEDRGPVDYRVAVYDAGWQMFMEKPLFGWTPSKIQQELSSRISGFNVDTFILHNTYLEIAVEHGLLGLALYLWVIVDLFRLGRKRLPTARAGSGGFLDQQFRALWPLIVLVFILNASFVVMNYQFVSGLLFTLAGILAAQNRRAEIEYAS